MTDPDSLGPELTRADSAGGPHLHPSSPLDLVVEADGGSRGNPGVAGYGALVRERHTGRLLAERAEPLGTASNNVAEYSGLIAGLTAATAIDPAAHVVVKMDSKLVVEQMAGRWKIKHENMRRLALQARELVRAIETSGGSVYFRCIPRAQNGAADALSNVAMDGSSVDRTFGGESTVDDLPTGDSDTSAETGTPARPGPATADAGSGPAGVNPGSRVTRLVLVRHGVTPFTEQGRLDGRGGADPSLSATGRAQALAAGQACEHLLAGQPASVLTSSLARAQETGAIIAAAIGALTAVDEAFDEQSFGDWDGARIADLPRDADQGFLRLRRDSAYARPGGESRVDLARRVLPAWERLATGGGTTIVVCHRMVILVILGHLLGLDDERAWRLAVAPGSLTAVEIWDSGEVQLAFVNRT